MHRRRFLLAGGAAAVSARPEGAGPATPPVHIRTGSLPPFVLDQGPRHGALHEVVEELLRRLHMPAQVEVLPWKRALVLTTTEPRSAVFPLSRVASRETEFRWLARLYRERYVFLVRDPARFDVSAPARMKARRIGIMRGSSLIGTLEELGYRTIVEANSPAECMRYLLGGMVDAVFGEAAIVRWSVAQRADRAAFQVSEPQATVQSWLAGSLDFTPADARRFETAMQAMTADGTYARILRGYGLTP
ncbi:transporter substrate-binding domain-containing protein [Massilia arenosa]|uniref:Transporter substrate-binding domain-containing protein n=1 Tax=Zemynaea arenosa TaxID=2561931 RepID=A0A4Y9SS23_9BURK|nr:transporter substrate-binding domain-containing protein [Massilia arenosa]TFW27994.1 transporter substrate-binding domain-containing protein [Massilia arenosa]